jgi:hypothetical protein
VVEPPPTPQDKLRAKTGFYAWVAWRLGEGPWQHYSPANKTVRPAVLRPDPARLVAPLRHVPTRPPTRQPPDHTRREAEDVSVAEGGIPWWGRLLTRRIEKLEDLQPAVLAERVDNLSEDVRALKRAFYTFAISAVASSITFAFAVFALLGRH